MKEASGREAWTFPERGVSSIESVGARILESRFQSLKGEESA